MEQASSFATTPMAEVPVSSAAFLGTCTAIWAALLAVSALQDLLTFLGIATGRIWMLDIEVENGFYTWFSTILLATAGLLTGIVALEKTQARDRLRYHWMILALVFFALSVDEACSIHEAASRRLSAWFDSEGYLFFAWVVPASIASAIGLLAFIPFILSFPRHLRIALLLAAAAFLTGAIGMEMIAGKLGAESGVVLASPEYRALATIEEALEGGAVILFLGVILHYRRLLSPTVLFHIR